VEEQRNPPALILLEKNLARNFEASNIDPDILYKKFFDAKLAIFLSSIVIRTNLK
jgi:hypothetical protein